MNRAPEVSLITIRVHRDLALPDNIFVSLRRYPIPGGAEPAESAEEASAEDAIALVTRWLKELDATE